MSKEFWFVMAVFTLFILLIIWAASVGNAEFKKECRSRGGIPIISKYENICYAPGTIIDVGVKGE